MKLTVMKVALFFSVLVSSAAFTLAEPASGQAEGAALHPAHSIQSLPVALRPALYRTLAKDAGAAYRINPNGCTTLPKQRLKACFDNEGVHFTGGVAPLSIHLVAYGRSGGQTPVGAVRPIIKGNRVSYTHGVLSGWWQVLPIGFEQGFTVAKRPSGQGKLTLVLATNDRATHHEDTLAWGKLRYGELVVTDAKGRVIPATLRSEDDRVLIAVNDAHAIYPLTVDPLVWLEQEVAANDGEATDQFGFSVALDGAIALVGANAATVGGNAAQGAIYVFTESDGIWTQTQKLIASDGTADGFFGGSVALNGATALVGATGATVGGNADQGAVYAFTESDGSWSEAQKLTATDGVAGDSFGSSVRLDGTTALIGAAGAIVDGNAGQGAAYVFTESDGTWSEAQKLTASDGEAGDNFGHSVALAGAIALVGANFATVGGNTDQGAAYVFIESVGTWGETQKLTADDGTVGDKFGSSLALSPTTAIVGAPFAAVGGHAHQGAAYVFNESDDTWSETQKLTASDGAAQDNFGYAIALEDATAVLGARGANFSQGAAYVFTESDGAWNEGQKLTASNGGVLNVFGDAVALSNTTVLVGAGNAAVNGIYQGAAYFYGQSDLGLAVNAPQTVGQGQQYTSQTIATNNASAASPAVSATITVPAAASFISATATQGSCSEASGVVTCDFGQISGNADTATANVTLKATGSPGTTINNTASVALAQPALTASTPTAITQAGCPTGYGEYQGSLNPGKFAHSPTYQAPAGEENGTLTGPTGFQLYVVFQNVQGRKVYRIPGNEIHRQAPAGSYTWVVKAGASGGAYTLCVMHP